MSEGTGELEPGTSKLYETSDGLLHVRFSHDPLVLTRVPPDGWFRVFGGGRQLKKSAASLERGLNVLGLPSGEAELLVQQILADADQIVVPPEPTRRQELKVALGLARVGLDLLAATPRFLWEAVRARPDTADPELAEGWVTPGSKEYGVIRVVQTSRGWFEFEFWGNSRRPAVGAYQADGWLPLRGQRFVEQSTLVDVLRDHGLADAEACEVARLVLDERKTRIDTDA